MSALEVVSAEESARVGARARLVAVLLLLGGAAFYRAHRQTG